MANAPVVITSSSSGGRGRGRVSGSSSGSGADDAAANGKLFEGISFFLVQVVPFRRSYIASIEANGGKVVKNESHADYLIADHNRADAPGGSYSFTFIEAAIRDGKLPNPGDHATGRSKGAVRDVASASIAAKSTRTPFTDEDDRVLWQWVEREKTFGGLVKGNGIYKRLEAENPRHTFQAWRNRYIKKLIDHPPRNVQLSPAANAHASPASCARTGKTPASTDPAWQERKSTPRKRRKISANASDNELARDVAVDEENIQADTTLLMGEAADIELIPEDNEVVAWAQFAQAYPQRTAKGWKKLYYSTVRPQFVEKQSAAASPHAEPQMTPDEDGILLNDAIRGQKRKRRPTPREGGNSQAAANQLGYSPPGRPSQEPRKFKRPEILPPVEHIKPNVANSTEVITIDSSQDSGNSQRRQETSGHLQLDAQNSSEQQIQLRLQRANPGLQEARNADLNPILTSEANHAAELQLQTESIGRSGLAKDEQSPEHDALGLLEHCLHLISHGPSSAVGADPAPEGETAPTSEPTKAGELLVQERVKTPKRTSKDVYGRSRSVTPSSSVAAAVEEQNRVEARSAAIATAGFALTEANLTAQEEQLRTPKARGIDIPEDDEAKDQGDFLRYLQQTMGLPITQPADVAVEDEDHEDDELPVEALCSRPRTARISGEELLDALVSSQEERDDVLESNFGWPMSPQQKRREAESESVPFETQFQSPNAQLPDQSQFQSAGQSLLAQMSSTSSQEQPGLEEEDEQAQPADAVSSPFAWGSQSQYVGDSSDREYLDSVEFEDEIDLGLAEPEGGFDLSPPPGGDERYSPLLEPEDQEQDQGPGGEPQVRPLSSQPKRGLIVEISSTSPYSSPVEKAARAQDTGKPDGLGAKGSGRAIDTQDISDAETHAPDLEIPLPPDSEDKLEKEFQSGDAEIIEHPQDARRKSFSKAPAQKQDFGLHADDEEADEAQEKSPSSQDDASKLEDWIATMKVRGYKETSIIKALKCTSMRHDLAQLVLISAKAGHGLPDDVPGIWSEAEDGMLESGNARGIRRLESKHGWDECEARLEYLTEWRAA